MVCLSNGTMKYTMLCLSYFLNSAFLVGSELQHVEYDVCHVSANDTPVTCDEECRMRAVCFSVVMHIMTRKSYLSMDNPTERETRPGSENTERTVFNSTQTPECDAAQCHVTQVCVSRDSGVTCEYREKTSTAPPNNRLVKVQYKRKCPHPTPVPNGQVLGNQRVVGARINITCDYKYRLLGPMSFVCGTNGAWENESSDKVEEMTSPRCLRVCPVPEHTVIIGSDSLEGTRITVVCEERYKLSGPAILTCQPDGTWSPEETSSISPVSTLSPVSTISQPSTTSQASNTSLASTNSKASVTSQASTSSQTSTECLPVCEQPPDIMNGVRSEELAGIEVTYSCEGIYRLLGPATFSCNPLHKWTPTGNTSQGYYDNDLMTSPPRCVVECPVPEVVEHAVLVGSDRLEGSKISVVCAERYILWGPSSLTCQPDGTWSPDEINGTIPTSTECIPVCEQPPDITNGIRTYDQRLVGNNVTYSCEGNYTLVGPTTFTCNMFHNWTAAGSMSQYNYGNDLMTSPPRCAIECPAPEVVEHAVVVGSDRQEGSRITVVCEERYILSGPGSLTCQPNGTWSPDEISRTILLSTECIPGCEQPPDITNGIRTYDQRFVGNNVTYSCEGDYTLVGPTTFTCNMFHNWTAVGSRSQDYYGNDLMTSPPRCTIVCEQPPDIMNGVRTDSQVSVGSRVTYSCEGDYTLVGPATFQCNSFQNWTATALCSKGHFGNDLMTSPPRCVIQECIVKPETAYQVHSNAMTWYDARDMCASSGGHLVSFSCEAEFKFVQSVAKKAGLREFYTGLNDLDHFCYWMWRDSTDETTFIPWRSDQPNNRGYDEHCGVINRARMNDRSCTLPFGFVCESEPGR